MFTGALFCAGVSLFCAASASTLAVAVVFVGLMGVSVGPVYVLGFVLLQQEVPDDLRGRVFSSLNTLVRLCVLISMVAGPLLAAVLGRVSSSLIEGRLDLPAGTLVAARRAPRAVAGRAHHRRRRLRRHGLAARRPARGAGRRVVRIRPRHNSR